MPSPIYHPLLKAGNQAVRINKPSDTDFHITEHGSDWLWTVVSIFLLFTIVYITAFFVLQFKGSRSFTRYAVGAPFLISFYQFFSYFTYASDLGWAGVKAEFHHVHVNRPMYTHPGTRQVFYCKYIAWFLSWPIVLFLQDLAALTTSGRNGFVGPAGVLEMIHSLGIQTVGVLIWVICLLVGILIPSTYRWGYWTIGIFIMFVTEGVILQRLIQVLHTRGVLLLLHLFMFLIVCTYFIAWACCEGGNKIQPDSEAVFYGILDLVLFAIYPSILVTVCAFWGEWPQFTLKDGGSYPYFPDGEPLPLGVRDVGPIGDEGPDAEITPHRGSTGDEMNYEKTEGPNSVRDSGETEVPRNSTAARTEPETDGESV